MTQHERIHQSLARLGQSVTPAASFENDVMRRIGQLGPARPGRVGRTRRILMKSTIGVAACTLLAVGAWVVLGTATPSLYAQAVEAMEKARTIHIVGKSLQDGKMVKMMEAFYERDVGVAEFTYSKDQPYFRVDDGTHCWRRRGSGPVVRSRSRDPVGMPRKVFRATTELLKGQQDARRDAGGDRIIDGAACKQYVVLRSDGRFRALIWIDGRNRLRRFDKQQPSGSGWQTYRTLAIQYDVPIDRSRFQVKTPPGVTVLDAEQLLAQFAPAKAIFKKELMGLIFAVHDLQRCDNGMIFIVCSTRPSEAVVRELGAAEGISYGDFQLDSSWKRVAGKERYYQAIHIASLSYRGTEVRWVLLHPLGDWPQPMETCELSAYVYTGGKLQEKYTQAGQDWYKRFSPLAELPLPGQPVPLGEVIAKVHADALAAEPLEGNVGILEASRQDEQGRWSRRHRRPSELPPHQFAEEVQAELEHLEQMRQQQAQQRAASDKPGG